MTKKHFKPIKEFIDLNFNHFNALVLKEAARAYVSHIKSGGKMFLALAGAMSTAEIGITLAQMIRQNKIHAISCTGANLEEDIFNLVGHKSYVMVPHYRYLTPKEEENLFKKGLNRVTDTCIPESAMVKVEKFFVDLLIQYDKENKSLFPHQYIYKIIREGKIKKYYEIDPQNSWVVAAAEKNLPLFVPGWEDSTLGNAFVARHLDGTIKNLNIIKSGLEYMKELVFWYKKMSKKSSIGFFQVGGGIAGDFPICVVPLIIQDLHQKVPFWGYFCQISDSTTSYGSYSGAHPNEKITWGKLSVDTPKFIIESDASIVAPLIFSYVLAS